MTRKITHFKNTLIEKAFRSRAKWRFSFRDIFFVPEIFKFSYYENLVTDDVIGCSSTIETWQGCCTLRNIPDGILKEVKNFVCCVALVITIKNKS